MSVGAARPAAVDAFERAVVVCEAIDDLERVRALLDDVSRRIAYAHELLDAERISGLIGALRRSGALEQELVQLHEKAHALVEQITAFTDPVHAAQAAALQVADELQSELMDARSELHTLRR